MTKYSIENIVKDYMSNNTEYSIEEDFNNIKNLKREITKIYKNNKYNLLLARNILITIRNCFPNHYKYLLHREISSKYNIVLNTLIFSISPSKYLINNIDLELLGNIKDEMCK